jgi:hypothetical protein
MLLVHTNTASQQTIKGAQIYTSFVYTYPSLSQNYLLKLETDCNFLRETKAREFFRFSQRNDPFFLECAKDLEKLETKVVGRLYNIIPIKKSYTYRIRACIVVILEESSRENPGADSEFSILDSQKNYLGPQTLPTESPVPTPKPIQPEKTKERHSKRSIEIKKEIEKASEEQNTHEEIFQGKKKNPSFQVKQQNLPKKSEASLRNSEEREQMTLFKKEPRENLEIKEELKTSHTSFRDINNESQMRASRIETFEEAGNSLVLKESKKNLRESALLEQSTEPPRLNCGLFKYTGQFLETLKKPFFEEVDSMFRNSFTCDVDRILAEGQSFRSTRYWVMTRNKTVCGLAVIGIDPWRWVDRRMYLLHLSTQIKDDAELLLNLVLERVWSSDSCNEIRVKLLHYQDPESESQAVDPNAKALFSMKGFKWKQLENNKETGQRTLVMGLARPPDAPKVTPNEPIEIEGVGVVFQQNNKVKEAPIKSPVDSRNLVLAALKALYQEDLGVVSIDETSENCLPFSEAFCRLAALRNFRYNDIRTSVAENKEELLKQIQSSLGDDEETGKLLDFKDLLSSTQSQEAKKASSAVLRCIYRPFSYTMSNLEGNRFFVLKSIEKMTNRSSKKTVYFSQTDDSGVSAFFLEIDSAEEGLENPENFVKSCLKGLEKTEESELVLWVPSFETKAFGFRPKLAKTDHPEGGSLAAGHRFVVKFDDSIFQGEILPEFEAGNDHIIQGDFIFGKKMLMFLWVENILVALRLNRFDSLPSSGRLGNPLHFGFGEKEELD